MHFANAIAIVVARIFMNAMFNCGMHTDNVIVTVRFFGVDDGFSTGKLMHMGFQDFAGRLRHDT
jgi:hypothetical protein